MTVNTTYVLQLEKLAMQISVRKPKFAYAGKI